MNAPEIFEIRQTPSQKTASGSAPAARAAAGQSKLRSNDSHAIANQAAALSPSLSISLSSVAEERHANLKSPKAGNLDRFSHAASTS